MAAAVTLAGTSAYYSITGLSNFYAGSSFAVIIMGIAIETSKVIGTSVLYQYRKVLTRSIKVYLTLAIVLSMIITSIGIYGFLIDAYQRTATKVELLDNEVEVISNKKTYFQNNIARIQTQIDNKSNRINTLSTVRTQQESRLQSLYNSSSFAAAKRTEALIKDADNQINILTLDIDRLNVNITSFNDSIGLLDRNILEKNGNSELSGEVGQLRFISKLTGLDMNTVVNWFTILLILIFDPLAIVLFIVFNQITSNSDSGHQTTTLAKNAPPIPYTASDSTVSVPENVHTEPIIKQKNNKPFYW